jgi:hypothetical protein
MWFNADSWWVVTAQLRMCRGLQVAELYVNLGYFCVQLLCQCGGQLRVCMLRSA